MLISPFIGFTLGVIFMALLTMLIVRRVTKPLTSVTASGCARR